MSTPLEPDHFYHIFNRANGNEKLFLTSENYNYFLKKYISYICPIADTYAYCLLPNHFHFLIKIKEIKIETNSTILSKPFSNLFSSYTQSFNKLFDRKGSLFMKNFKRKTIDSDEYLRKIVHYIHLNPVNHGYTSNLIDWPHNSYSGIIENTISWIKRDEVIGIFGDKTNFIYVHQNPVEETGI